MNSPEQQNQVAGTSGFYFGDPPAFVGNASFPEASSRQGVQPPPTLLTDPREHRNFFMRLGLFFMTLTLVFQNFAYLVSAVVSFTAPWVAQTWWYSWVLTDVSLYIVALPLAWLTLRGLPTAPFNATFRSQGVVAEKPRFGFGWWAVIAIISAGVMQIGGLIGNWIMNLCSLLAGYDYANGLESMVNDSPLWATCIGTVLIAPIGEEFIFRKLLIDRSRRYGDTISILLSGILFGLFHGNLFQLFYTVMLGILLGYVYTRTGKIGWCIGLHALVNFLGGVIPTLLQNWIGRDNLEDSERLAEQLRQNPLQYLVYMLYGMAIYACILAAIVLLICLRKKIRLGDGSVILPAGKRFRTVVCNVGMILAFVVSLLTILFQLILPPLTEYLSSLTM